MIATMLRRCFRRNMENKYKLKYWFIKRLNVNCNNRTSKTRRGKLLPHCSLIPSFIEKSGWSLWFFDSGQDTILDSLVNSGPRVLRILQNYDNLIFLWTFWVLRTRILQNNDNLIILGSLWILGILEILHPWKPARFFSDHRILGILDYRNQSGNNLQAPLDPQDSLDPPDSSYPLDSPDPLDPLNFEFMSSCRRTILMSRKAADPEDVATMQSYLMGRGCNWRLKFGWGRTTDINRR